MSTINAAQMRELIKKHGIVRVTSDAANLFAEVLETIGVRISKEAISITEHDGRKTVRETDIKKAVKSFLNEYSEVVI
jgi:DNA-binding protein